MAIQLQFCGFTSFVSRFISYGTEGCGIAHVDAVDAAGDLWGAQEQALGGRPSGFQIRPANYGDSCGMINKTLVTLHVSDVEEYAFWSFLRSQLGKPYDLTAIAAFVADRDWHDPAAWFCSEVQAAALEAARVINPLAVPVNKVTPVELLLVCSAIGDVTK